jgi:murein DD-endopeptidase MepM/ murein hydrolase activator NlpD
MRPGLLVLAAGLGGLYLLGSSSTSSRPQRTVMRGVVEYGRIISHFGCRPRPGLAPGTTIGPCPDRQQFHLGLDIAANEGDFIYACNEGVVGAVHPDGSMAGYGNTVILWHTDGRSSLYAHQRDLPLVIRGQRVAQGQKIGRVGRTEAGQIGPRADSGATMTPHCHFEVLLAHTTHAAGYGTRAGTLPARTPYPARMDPARYLQAVNFAAFQRPYSARRAA